MGVFCEEFYNLKNKKYISTISVKSLLPSESISEIPQYYTIPLSFRTALRACSSMRKRLYNV